ncbi:MAG: histidine phosphatase family protein [Syntrophothermus sp.]
MNNFLLIRHGNSEAAAFAPGRMSDVHLSDEGKKQAARLAHHLQDYKIDMVISSPLDRTMETAGIIATYLKIKVQIMDGLLELDLGEWTGMTFLQLEKNSSWKQYHSHRSAVRIPGGEMFIETQKRMVNIIQELKERYTDSTIALVSHGDPIKSVICYYAGIPVDKSNDIDIDTASASMLAIDDYNAEIKFVNKWGSRLR